MSAAVQLRRPGTRADQYVQTHPQIQAGQKTRRCGKCSRIWGLSGTAWRLHPIYKFVGECCPKTAKGEA